MDATALLEADPAGLSGPELSARLIELVRLRSRVEAALVTTVDRWDAVAQWRADGAASGEAWIAYWCGQSFEDAGRLVAVTRQLRSMPGTTEAFVSGALSAAKVDLLIALAADDALAEAFARDETTLVAAVANLTLAEASRIAGSWRSLVDPARFVADARRLWQERRFDLVQQPGGRWVADASLDPEGGAVLSAAVDRLADQLLASGGGPPDVTSWQRRADALVDLARRAFATPPGATRERPLLVVLVDAAGAGPAEAGVGRIQAEPVPPVVVERLVCDAEVATVLTDGPDVVGSRPIVRTLTDGQLRALWVRDGGCVFPGCGRAASGCEAHRIASVEHGVTIELADLCLVCATHHRLLHEGGFSVSRLSDGRLPFTRPDGSPLLGPGTRLDAYGRPVELPPHA